MLRLTEAEETAKGTTDWTGVNLASIMTVECAKPTAGENQIKTNALLTRIWQRGVREG